MILTIANLWHAASRIWTCAEPEFRLTWMKLLSSDNHYTTAPRWWTPSDDELFFLGRLGPKNWSSLYWLKSGTDINCLFHVSNLMFFFLIFHSYFFAQIWSHNLKFFKLTESWHRGTLLYAYHSFNISCSKIFVIHSSLSKFGPNLIQKSLIVNRFSVSQHSNCYVQVHKDNFIIQ